MNIQPIAAAAPTANAAAAGKSTTNTATDATSMFMKLLATELQSQDPTQSMDPTTMVTQMVQVNQLNDVAGIYSILQQQTGATTTGAARTTTAQNSHNTLGAN